VDVGEDRRTDERRSVSLPINHPDRRRRIVRQPSVDSGTSGIDMATVVGNPLVDDK